MVIYFNSKCVLTLKLWFSGKFWIESGRPIDYVNIEEKVVVLPVDLGPLLWMPRKFVFLQPKIGTTKFISLDLFYFGCVQQLTLYIRRRSIVMT